MPKGKTQEQMTADVMRLFGGRDFNEMVGASEFKAGGIPGTGSLYQGGIPGISASPEPKSLRFKVKGGAIPEHATPNLVQVDLTPDGTYDVWFYKQKGGQFSSVAVKFRVRPESLKGVVMQHAGIRQLDPLRPKSRRNRM